MKTTLRITLLACMLLGHPFVQAATNYWDGNTSSLGAGLAPNGTWDVDAFWSTDPAGGASTTVWTPGNTAVFSAGNTAVDAFTVTVNASVNASGMVFEEGMPTVVGGTITMDAPDFPIVAKTNATITAGLEDGAGFGFIKSGPGSLNLGGASGHSGTNTIAEGEVAISSTSALGNTLVPTIVSNGATLKVTVSGASEQVILNGSGTTNSGAFRDALPGAGSFSGKLILGSDARVEHSGNANFSFTAQYLDGTNNANGFANLTIGGDGSGFHRFNIAGPAIRLGKGVLIKEGLCQHNFEVVNDIGAIYFNRGHLNWRESGGGGTGVVYVAATAGEIRCTAVNKTNNNNIELATGAIAAINVGDKAPNGIETNGPLSFTGVISGPGGLSKTNAGVAVLYNTNLYQGNTTIKMGALTLGGGSSISNSPVIDLWAGGSFDVLALPGGFVLEAAQTLKGNGTVWGNVIAKGAISPGASVGSLTNIGNLILAGSLLIDVDKSLSPGSSNDFITVTGALSHGGGATLTVVNLGPTLAVNDRFQIFNQPVSGGHTISVTGGGATWTNRLAFDGSIGVLTLSVTPPPVPATNLTVTAVGPNSVGLGGKGAANAAYDVYAYTNVAAAMSNWWKLGTTNASAGGVIQFVDPQATNAYRFYRFGQPSP